MAERDFTIFFPLLLLVPILLSGFAWLKSLKYKSGEFKHLTEFYLSIVLVAAASRYLIPLESAFIILSMIPWIWSLRTFGLLTGDISKQSLFTKLHLVVLAVGGVSSIVFLAFDFSLAMVTAPFALSIALTGLTFVFQAYAKGRGKHYSALQHFTLFLFLGFFISRLFFPVLINDIESAETQIMLDTFILITFGSFIYPLFAEIVFEKQERYLEEVLQTRNRQLFSHSGFSEYRILAAGVSHEVNNALLIINAKISQLLRGRSKDPPTDLRKIEHATNRIVRSIRGLREFLYPHDLQEVLDLGEIAKEVLDLYGQRLINHEVKVNLESLNGKLVKGQRVQLEQVFLSLINNSVDATEQLEEKWIKISAHAATEYVEITYQDSSPSKAEQIMPLLSNPFYTSDKLFENDVRLVLAKEIIEKYGGDFRCAPNRENSTFIIILPLSKDLRSTEMNYQTKIEEFKELH